MIINNEDLLPLSGSNGNGHGAGTAVKTADQDFGDFTSRVADTFDSVELLLAARAEAEEAEEQAKKAPQTPLPYLKEDKKSGGQAPGGR